MLTNASHVDTVFQFLGIRESCCGPGFSIGQDSGILRPGEKIKVDLLFNPPLEEVPVVHKRLYCVLAKFSKVLTANLVAGVEEMKFRASLNWRNWATLDFVR